jgi:hypothetical protein
MAEPTISATGASARSGRRAFPLMAGAPVAEIVGSAIRRRLSLCNASTHGEWEEPHSSCKSTAIHGRLAFRRRKIIHMV